MGRRWGGRRGGGEHEQVVGGDDLQTQERVVAAEGGFRGLSQTQLPFVVL